MDIIHAVGPLTVLSGFGVGMLVGLTGVGGGSLMTPLLVLLFGVHVTTAVGTDLLYAAATKTVGAAVHGGARTIDWAVTRRLALGSVPAAALTLAALHLLGGRSDAVGTVITFALGLALIAAAVSIVLHRRLTAFAARFGGPSPQRIRRLTIATGAVLGVLVSLSSVGAGAIGMTALVALYPRIPVARLVGSDIAHAVPLTLVAGLGYWLLGSVNWPLLGSLLVGSIPGIALGSLLASRVPERVLRPLLASIMAFAGIRLLG